ncbi:MAG: hypothetical protein HC915_10355 [Anaerolineae bacterium]|nr:hypothetical protein [Anaerolineae bacterium]
MVVPWLFLILFLLMGVAPLAAWRKASAARLGKSVRLPGYLALAVFFVLLLMGRDPIVDFGFAVVAFAGFATLLEIYKGVQARYRTHGESIPQALVQLMGRNPRRYGGYIIHLGVVIIGIGIIASTAFQEVRQVTLQPSQSLDIGPYSLRYDRVFEAVAVDERGMLIAEVALFREGDFVRDLRPRRDYFGPEMSPMTIAGVHSTFENDVYVLLTFQQDDAVTLRVYRNPLVNFVWGGSLLLVLGTAIAVYPTPQKQPVARRARSAAWAMRPDSAAGD